MQTSADPKPSCNAAACGAVQLAVGDVQAELDRAMKLQASTSAALNEAVRDKLKAEADLNTAMVSCRWAAAKLNASTSRTLPGKGMCLTMSVAASCYLGRCYVCIQHRGLFSVMKQHTSSSAADINSCLVQCCVCALAQAAQPLAAKLLSGAQNASYQANATRDAARQAVLEASQKLDSLQEQLQSARDTRQATQAVLRAVPAQWGKTHFKVSRDQTTSHLAWQCLHKSASPTPCSYMKDIQDAQAHSHTAPSFPVPVL